VSGTWNAEAIRKKLGDHYGACKLPTYTLDGRQAQMGSFSGTKLMGISAATMNPQEADELAAYLTGEHAQVIRYKVRSLGPSNIKAASFQEIRDNVALAALMEQKEHSVSPIVVGGAFWEAALVFGEAMENHSQEDMSALLNELVMTIVGN